MQIDDIDDADFILTGKKNKMKDDEARSNEGSKYIQLALNFIDLLANGYDETLDPATCQSSLSSCIDEWLQPKKIEKPSIRPYASIVDLNNDEKTPYENKPKNAIEVGIEVEF